MSTPTPSQHELELEDEPRLEVAVIVIATESSPGSAATLAEELWHGRPMVRVVAERLEGFDPVVVVMRDEDAVSHLDGLPGIIAIVDPEWSEGAAAPLRAALDYLTHSADAQAAVVLSLRTPEIAPEVLRRLAAASADAVAPVAVPKYRYARSSPVLLRREIWPRFLGAEGDLDLEHLLLAHPQWVIEVRVDHPPPRRIAVAGDLLELSG